MIFNLEFQILYNYRKPSIYISRNSLIIINYNFSKINNIANEMLLRMYEIIQT